MVSFGDSDENMMHWSPNKECISSNCKHSYNIQMALIKCIYLLDIDIFIN